MNFRFRLTIAVAAFLFAASSRAFAQTPHSTGVNPEASEIHIPAASEGQTRGVDVSAQETGAVISSRITGQRMTHSALLAQTVRNRIEAPSAALPAKKRPVHARPGSRVETANSDPLIVDLSAPSKPLPAYPTPKPAKNQTLGAPTFGPPQPNFGALPSGPAVPSGPPTPPQS